MFIAIVINIFAFMVWMTVGVWVTTLIGKAIEKTNISLWYLDKITEYELTDRTKTATILLTVYVLSLTCLWPFIALHWIILWLSRRF